MYLLFIQILVLATLSVHFYKTAALQPQFCKSGTK